MNYQCRLIIDSCCDLPREVVDREGVDVIGFPYFFGDEEHADDLWATSTPHDFYERMRKGEQPTTAQASIPALTEAFTKAAEDGTPAVYLAFTSGLSASFDQTCLVADRIREQYPDFELYVVDTFMASVGEGLVAFEALRQQERGLTAAELAQWAEQARYFANVYFMVEDLECLHRGGRIPSSVAVVGSKLDVKPILFIAADGTLSVKGVARGRKKGLKQLAQFYTDRHDKTMPACAVIGSADIQKDVERLEEILESDGETPLFVESSIGPVIGSHVGPGMVACAFWGLDRREDLSTVDKIARRVHAGK